MDLLKILDATPEPPIIDPTNLVVDTEYSRSQDYKIITPLTDFQKELFDQIVSLHYSDILKFYIQFQNDDANLKDQLIIDSLKVLLENSSSVSNHPYLLIDHFFPKNLTSRDIHKKLIETSGKFEVLNNLLSIIESLYVDTKKGLKLLSSRSSLEAFNLVIVSRPGKCMDLIESLLLSHSCNIKRYAGEKLSSGAKSKKTSQQLDDDENGSGFNIHLLPSEFDKMNESMYKQLTTKTNLNLLISFDISVNTEEEYIQNLLSTNSMPVLRLVPNNTIEHIALYFRKSFKDRSNIDYLKPVTLAIVCLRDKVGLIPSELKSIYATNLKYLSDWFKQLSPETLLIPEPRQQELNNWPLPDLRPIRNFNSNDVEKSLLKEVKFENDEDELLQLPNHYKIRAPTKISYYKSKRLIPVSYISNPIEYDSYNKITGISSTLPENDSILTHKTILNFNLILQQNDLMEKELQNFEYIKTIRLEDIDVVDTSYNKIEKEVKILREQIALKNEELLKKQSQIDESKQQIKEIDNKIANDEVKADYLQRKELKEAIDQKIINKKQENEYMLKEIENARNSIQESELKIVSLKLENTSIYEQLNNRELPNFKFDKKEVDSIIKSNNDLIKILERNLRKINDIPISQKLRINGVNNNIFGEKFRR